VLSNTAFFSKQSLRLGRLEQFFTWHSSVTKTFSREKEFIILIKSGHTNTCVKNNFGNFFKVRQRLFQFVTHSSPSPLLGEGQVKLKNREFKNCTIYYIVQKTRHKCDLSEESLSQKFGTKLFKTHNGQLVLPP
jgi:hypothetical protein